MVMNWTFFNKHYHHVTDPIHTGCNHHSGVIANDATKWVKVEWRLEDGDDRLLPLKQVGHCMCETVWTGAKLYESVKMYETEWNLAKLCKNVWTVKLYETLWIAWNGVKLCETGNTVCHCVELYEAVRNCMKCCKTVWNCTNYETVNNCVGL